MQRAVGGEWRRAVEDAEYFKAALIRSKICQLKKRHTAKIKNEPSAIRAGGSFISFNCVCEENVTIKKKEEEGKMRTV